MKNLSGNANYLPKEKESNVEETVEKFDSKELEIFIQECNDLAEKAERLYSCKSTKEMYDTLIRLYGLKREVARLKEHLN